VHKYVSALCTLDKPITLPFAEPLHGSGFAFTHRENSFKMVDFSGMRTIPCTHPKKNRPGFGKQGGDLVGVRLDLHP
jgi:hypothetical protein